MQSHACMHTLACSVMHVHSCMQSFTHTPSCMHTWSHARLCPLACACPVAACACTLTHMHSGMFTCAHTVHTLVHAPSCSPICARAMNIHCYALQNFYYYGWIDITVKNFHLAITFAINNNSKFLHIYTCLLILLLNSLANFYLFNYFKFLNATHRRCKGRDAKILPQAINLWSGATSIKSEGCAHLWLLSCLTLYCGDIFSCWLSLFIQATSVIYHWNQYDELSKKCRFISPSLFNGKWNAYSSIIYTRIIICLTSASAAPLSPSDQSKHNWLREVSTVMHASMLGENIRVYTKKNNWIGCALWPSSKQ